MKELLKKVESQSRAHNVIALLWTVGVGVLPINTRWPSTQIPPCSHVTHHFYHMAYSRYRRRNVRRRRNPIRRRRVTRSRRVRTRRVRPMTRRRILNITTTKKQDAMPQRTYGDTDTVGSQTSMRINTTVDDPLNVKAQTFLLAPFIPTARVRPDDAGTSDSVTRENAETFAVGYSEKIRIQIYRGQPWMWRRIVFMNKGPDLITNIEPVPADPGNNIPAQPPQFFFPSLTAGMQRLTAPANASTATILASRLFQGTQGSDWSNLLDAKVDTRRVTLISDKTRTMNGGNADGRIMNLNLFYPIRKRLVYNDVEDGYAEAESYFSAVTNDSCGDMYIVDMFHAGPSPGSITDGYLDFAVQGKYYWHER